jgi:hypothetical protein
VVYTPAAVASYLAEQALERVPDSESGPRVLDPACGVGALLLAAYEVLLRRRQESGPRLTLRERGRLANECLFGIDIDPVAVETTRLALRRAVLNGESKDGGATPLPDFVDNIRCGNALVDEQAEFDVVVGNPPYLSYSGRQAVALPAEERAYYQAHYCASGWLTAHGMFIELAARLARRAVAMIVPGQVGHLAGYAGVREALVRRMGPVEVRYWGESVFPGITTPALTFVADTAYRGPVRIVSPIGREEEAHVRGGEAWVAAGGGRLIDKLRDGAGSLGKLVADPGVHTGNCARQLVCAAADAPKQSAPLLEGRQVSRYACAPAERVLRLDYRPRRGEYFRIGAEPDYADVPFVIRQTAAWPIVGPRRGAVHFRNSLLALRRPVDGTDVRYVVALLNSRLLRYVYRQTVHESRQRAFPQVKVRSLRALPIRWPDLANAAERQRHDEIVRLAGRLLALHEELAEADAGRRAAVERRIAEADRRLDRLVYEVYGLTPAEIDQVEADEGEGAVSGTAPGLV